MGTAVDLAPSVVFCNPWEPTPNGSFTLREIELFVGMILFGCV